MLTDSSTLPSTWSVASVVLSRSPYHTRVAGVNVQVEVSLRIDRTQARVVFYCEPLITGLSHSTRSQVEGTLVQWARETGFTFTVPEPQNRIRWWAGKTLVLGPHEKLVNQVDDWLFSLATPEASIVGQSFVAPC